MAESQLTEREVALSLSTRLAFGAGAVGESIFHGLFNTFIQLYYNQAVGLSNSYIGIAIMLAMIGDAISDPVVGIISDRWRSPHGRRHPFLFIAPVPLALCLYGIFNPPEALLPAALDAQWPLFLWLAVLTIVGRFCVTLYSVPHLALGGELSSNQFQRSQLFSMNTVFYYGAGAGFAFLAWSVFFAGERIRATDDATVPGQLDPAAYGPLILLAAATLIVAIWTCAALTYRHVPRLSQAPSEQAPMTPVSFLKEIFGTFRNRNYLFLLIGFFFFMIASGIYDTFNVFISTYFWELKPDQIRWLGLIAAPAAITGAVLSPVLMRRFDRKPVLLSALAGTMVFAQLVIDLRLLGLMPPNGSPALLPMVLANAAAFTFCLGLGTVAIMGMVGDVIDENELATGLRQEGLFFSARAFFSKASYSVGHFVAGVSLDLFVRLPFEAVPGALDQDTLNRLGIMAGPIMGLAGGIALLFYSRYRLDRQRHGEILAELEQRPQSQAQALRQRAAADAPHRARQSADSKPARAPDPLR